MNNTAKIINGKSIANALCAEIARDVARHKAEYGIHIGLAVVLVGEDPASQIYVRNKQKKCASLGINSIKHCLPANISEIELLKLIAELNADRSINGILVQLPLPEHLKSQTIIDAIDPNKDVDGLHAQNAGRLLLNMQGFVSCTPQGVLRLIKQVEPNLQGLDAVVIGRSNLVGKPVSQLLLQENCTVTMAHSKSKNLPQIAARADIIVAAVGYPELVKKSWIKDGAIIIDVGINRVAGDKPNSTKLVGDVAFDEVSQKAKAITPVPGGVGPMTIACLMENTLLAAKIQAGLL